VALNFPASPSDGDIYGDHYYDAAKGAWRVSDLAPLSPVYTSDTPPSSPIDGDQWLYTGDGTLFVYYADVDGGQWIQTSGVAVEPKTDNLPAGSVIMWAASAAPTNWLLCDGSVVSRATYPSLFASIGTTYNTSGETIEQFRLPNLKGRVVVGLDSSQTEFDTLGETGGAKTHTLTSSEMPSHTHTYSGTTTTDGSHTHTFGANQNGVAAHATGGGGYAVGFTNAGSGEMMFYRQMDAAGSHSHTYSGTTVSAGSGGAHNNLQPYITLNYIIKATAGVTVGDTALETRVGSLETSSTTPIKLNGQTISTNYSIPLGYNGLSAGPITIANGVTVTIPDGSAWSVV
jgi:microcystin-dependent protein